ncbi:hypothetical protein Q1695_003399 [Nippostrongylus brasiliensis]|nr:hypothetical protein Q1695_003399 [Nippostrongylus brasiliensis]
MKQVNVVLIVGVTIVFLFLNIYGLIEILRYLRDKQQLLRQGFNDEDEFLSTTEGTTTTRPTEPPTTTTIIFSSSTRASPVITSTYSKETNRISSTTTLARTTNSRERSRAPEHRHRHHHHHQQQHQHHSGTHRGHPLFIPTALTTPSTTTSRIHITTNKIFIPDPTTDRPRIEVHRPAPTETPRAELPRFGTPLYLPKSSSPAPPSRTVPPTTTTTISTTTSTTFRTTTSSTQPANEKDDVTIVTALLDIGRGEWDRYRRPLEQYHIFMENLLSLKNNMVIFTDLASYSFIHKYRKNMGEIHRTKIHLITLDDLPLSRHLAAASKIIEEERRDEKLWRSIWDPAMKDHPEARSAEYDVLVNSKTYFLYNASLEDPFSTEFFVWIDAGYGHGNQSVFPYNNRWTPHFPRGKISLIKLTPMHDSIRGYTIDSLYRRNWSVVSGGFVAGDKRAIGQLHTLVHRKFIELTYRNKVDDDQTVLVLVINSHPHLFSITHGDWFDAFRLFSRDESWYGR